MKRVINFFAMKKYIRFGVVAFCIGLAPLSAYADEPFTIEVPSNCTVTDTADVEHTFPQDDSPSDYLGICMLEAAKAAGLITFTLTNDLNFGLYIQSVNDIEPGATEYWAIWQNSVMAACGIGCLPVAQGDTLSFILTDWVTNAESTMIALRANLLAPPPPRSGGGGGGGGIPSSQLNIANALAYLTSTQHEDGSFDSPMLSDWAALAFAATDSGEAKEKLRAYMLTATPPLSSVTDYERHAMALAALAINPYADTPVDYIAPIVNSFDGKQIGDPSLDNDDIFALFPLLSVGYSTNDPLIQKTTAFILSRQRQNGSWNESVDMTAAAIQALVQVRILPDVSLALIRAEGYLRKEQPREAIPGSSFSMSWVRQAISALSWTPSGWTPNSFTREDHLAGLQQSDGGVEPESSGTQTRVWATAYAIPAALGKPWPWLLQSFMRPSEERGSTKASRSNVKQIATTSTKSAFPVAVVASTTPVESVVAVESQGLKPKVKERFSPSPRMPVLIDNQMAAVANAPTDGFFSRLWSSIAAFFSNLL